VQKPKSIRELLNKGGKRLGALKDQTRARAVTLEHVCAALPPQLARCVVSAGLVEGTLTIGVTNANWASRLRYSTDALRTPVGASLGKEIHSVRIKVIPPRT
jgi:hypothetical protein